MTASERINNQPQEKEENSDNVHTHTYKCGMCVYMHVEGEVQFIYEKEMLELNNK